MGRKRSAYSFKEANINRGTVGVHTEVRRLGMVSANDPNEIVLRRHTGTVGERISHRHDFEWLISPQACGVVKSMFVARVRDILPALIAEDGQCIGDASKWKELSVIVSSATL